MQDARTPDGAWVKDAEVYVQAPKVAKGSPQTMAVLEVRPRNAEFYIGWRSPGKAAEFFSKEAKTQNCALAMRVGAEDAIFVARPCDGQTRLFIELIELVAVDDPRYPELPWY